MFLCIRYKIKSIYLKKISLFHEYLLNLLFKLIGDKMEMDYLCPECKSLLNISDKIVLSVRLKNKQNGLLLLDNLLGDYNVKKQNVLHYKEGDLVEFFCPICHEALQSKVHPNLARLIISDDEENESNILFSRILGERATYKISENKIESFGKDQDVYLEIVNNI
jgi:hypothetical protein